MAVIHTRFIEANGLTFETDIAGAGERFALLLHGFPENKHAWRFQLPFLAERGFTAWAPNLRGYGRSSRPSGRRAYTFEHLTEDVAELIGAARAEHAYKDVTLIAHDWGGGIAWALATERPELIDRLVILNVPHPAEFRRQFWHSPQFLRSWYMFFFQLPWLPERLAGAKNGEAIGRAMRDMAGDKTNFTDSDLAPFRAAASDPGALTAMINYYRATVLSPMYHRISSPKANPIETPALLIWGERDFALRKELAYGTRAFVRNLTIRTLPGVSHWVQQEAPAAVNAMIGAFLAGEAVPFAPGA